MTRILSLVFVAVVALALFLLPEVAGPRFAALDAHELLHLPPASTEDAGNAGDASASLAERVLAGPAVAVDGASGARTLRLGEVQVAGETSLGPAARRAVLRSLREAASARALPPLSVDGELEPCAVTDAGAGASFRVGLDGDRHWIEYRGPQNADIGAPADLTVARTWTPPLRSSLLPPLVAIVLAILLRRPVIALFAGVLVAAWLRRRAEGAPLESALESALAAAAYVPPSLHPDPPGGGPAWWAKLRPCLPDWITRDLWPQIADPDRSMIIAFVILMLAMIGVITRAGGIRGLMDAIAGLAKGVKSTQVATWLMGLVVFFDDYANTILVGSTMRPLCDRFRIAREKLAYIVDSTAAPVAGLSIFSTWIAFEVSTYSAQLPAAGLAPSDGYQVFLQSLPFRFYSILTLGFVGMVAMFGRDFGPMLRAERRARQTGDLVRPGGSPMVSAHGTDLEPAPGIEPHAAAAIYPILTFLALTLAHILRTGGVFEIDWLAVVREGRFIETAVTAIGNGSSTMALVIGSGAGLWVAAAIGHAKGMRPFGDILRAAPRHAARSGHRDRHPVPGLDDRRRVSGAAHGYLSDGAARRPRHAGAVAGAPVPAVGRRGVLDRVVVEHDEHPAAAGRGPLLHAGRVDRAGRHGPVDPDHRRRARGCHLRGPLLSDLGHDRAVLHGLGVGPHRPRSHSSALRRPDDGCSSRGRLPALRAGPELEALVRHRRRIRDPGAGTPRLRPLGDQRAAARLTSPDSASPDPEPCPSRAS